MSVLSINSSIIRAERRLRGSGARGPRGDRGVARINARAEAALQRLLHTRDKPAINAVATQLQSYCARVGISAPSRASVYNAVQRAVAPSFTTDAMPQAMRDALYNLDLSTRLSVPGDQLVFYAFNYGSPAAISFAAALPWLCLAKAANLRGWRPKSRALLQAVCVYRRICT